MTVSYWRRTATVLPPRVVEALPSPGGGGAGAGSGSGGWDVVVIGAGVCGVSAALHLERRGARVCILDGAGVAHGASGRNAGFLMRGCADNYAVASEEYGRERAKALWKLTEDTLAGLRREGIENLPTVERVPSCLLAFDEAERAELERSAALLKEDGFAAEWIEQGSALAPDDDAWARGGPMGGLVNPNDGAANSVDLLHFLAGKVKGPIVAAGVERVTETPKGVRVETTRGALECGRALVCLNAYAPLVADALRGVVEPKRGQMLAVRPPSGAKPPRLAMSYYANRGYEYFRQPRRGGASPDGTIVVGGWRRRFAATEVGYEDVTTHEVQRGLEGFAAHALGLDFARCEVTDRWSGVMGFTPDGLPRIGPITPEGRAWFIGGFTGHGMSMGFETTRLAVGAMLDGALNPFPM